MDKNFSSGLLTGASFEFLMLALPLSDSPAASRSAPPGDYPPSSRAPARPASADGPELLLADTHDPPAPTLVHRPDRWRKQASAPEPLVGPRLPPGPPGGHPEDVARGVPDMPAVRLAARFRQGAAAGHSPGHPPLPIGSSLRTPGSGWPGDGHGGPLDRPVGRTSPVQGDRPADGYGPGPDGGGQAADTSNAQRPTMRPVSRPRPTTRPGRPGPDRTGQDRTAMRMLPSANPSRYQHRDPSVVTPAPVLDAGPSASLVPVRCPRGRVRCPPWTPRSDRFPDTARPVVSRPLHPAHHGEPEATRTGNGRTARKVLRHPRSPRPQGGPPGHAEPHLWAGVCGLATKVGSAMARCQPDRNPRQRPGACSVAPSAKPRLGALLSLE
jgi:hypothetical protein